MLHIETPTDLILRTPLCVINGWCTFSDSSGSLSWRIGEQGGTISRIERPDVQAAFPSVNSAGFSLVLDLGAHLAAVAAECVPFQILANGTLIDEVNLQLAPGVRETAEIGNDSRHRKREWCLKRLQCPVCANSSLNLTSDVITCHSCEAMFPQNTRALNFINQQLSEDNQLRHTSNVSANAYEVAAVELINWARSRKGKVLDCGAGLRHFHDDTIVNCEIVDYPSTDVLAVGQALPFRDESFDGVLSLAVLEHVSDPFKCASEMARVLKRNGRMVCIVPFLQPEHGYPNHFFNMTRQGIAELFREKLEIEQHFIPRSGTPIWSLHWFLDLYSRGLDEPNRRRFQAMSVAEILAKSPVEWLSEDIAAGLSERANWELASTTALVMKKPLH